MFREEPSESFFSCQAFGHSENHGEAKEEKEIKEEGEIMEMAKPEDEVKEAKDKLGSEAEI